MKVLTRVIGAALVAATLSLGGTALAADVALTTPEGAKIAGTELGTGEKGVLFVHNDGRSRSDWEAFATKLSGQGYHVLSIDLRGHGDSAPERPEDNNELVADVQAGVAYLKANGATSVAIVGAKLGANLAVNAAAADPSVTNLVLLSPGMNVKGVSASTALEQYGARPALIVASSDSAYDNKSALFLEGKGKGVCHYEMLTGAGSGAKMLNRDPDLENMVISWLNGTFFRGDGTKGGEKNLSTGDTSTVETTGTKFGEKKKTP